MNPRTTRAILIERLGRPGVLVERAVALRDPGDGEVHLRVAAAGVNFADLAAGLRVIGTAGGERKCRFVTEQLRADACFRFAGRMGGCGVGGWLRTGA